MNNGNARSKGIVGRVLGTTALMAFAGWFSVGGCSEDSDGGAPLDRGCEELCSLAQDGNCTSISGDCSEVCPAAARTDEPAGCTAQADAYNDCLNQDEDVCAGNCDSAENDYAQCLAAYCLGNAGEPDCMILLSAFN